MFRQLTREKRLFGPQDDIMVTGTDTRFAGAPCRVRVPVDIDDPDLARLDDRRERVLFRIPPSDAGSLLKKNNVDED
jgi:hypothetical protein